MYLKFIFLIFIISAYSEETIKEQKSKLPSKIEKPVEEIKTENLNIEKKENIDSKKNQTPPEKKISVSSSISQGFGDLGIQLSPRDPTYSPTEFVYNSIFAVSLISANTANNLSGNLSPTSFAGFLILNEELKKEIYNAKSDSVYNRFYVHHKTKSEEVGYSFGLSSGFYAIQTDSSRDILSFLPLIFFPNNSPLINQFAVISYNHSKIPIYTNITTFDFFVTKHFIPNDRFDFYLALGGGIGGCLIECRAIKFSPKAGAKYFFDEDIYFYLETEFNYMLLFDSERKYTPMREKVFTMGIGAYL